MILRIVRGVIGPGRPEPVDEALLERSLPVTRAAPGLVRFHVAVRPEGERRRVAIVTFWASVEAAIHAYGGDPGAPHSLDAVARGGAEPTKVAYFEVDETQLRRSERDPAILRVTVGRVTRGLDAAIQQELRSRMHELDESMTEAYVGRRILGSEVEVMFISAWERVPPGRSSLDEPLWPDISAKYDVFSVETYVPLVSGSPAG